MQSVFERANPKAQGKEIIFPFGDITSKLLIFREIYFLMKLVVIVFFDFHFLFPENTDQRSTSIIE